MARKRRRIIIEIPEGSEYMTDRVNITTLFKDALISFLESRANGDAEQYCKDVADIYNDDYYLREGYVTSTANRFKFAKTLQRAHFTIEDFDSHWDYDEDDDDNAEEEIVERVVTKKMNKSEARQAVVDWIHRNKYDVTIPISELMYGDLMNVWYIDQGNGYILYVDSNKSVTYYSTKNGVHTPFVPSSK